MAFPEQRPRFMLLGPSNEILLSDTSRNESISAVKDGCKTAIITKLDRPYGLALSGEWLYLPRLKPQLRHSCARCLGRFRLT